MKRIETDYEYHEAVGYSVFHFAMLLVQISGWLILHDMLFGGILLIVLSGIFLFPLVIEIIGANK